MYWRTGEKKVSARGYLPRMIPSALCFLFFSLSKPLRTREILVYFTIGLLVRPRRGSGPDLQCSLTSIQSRKNKTTCYIPNSRKVAF